MMMGFMGKEQCAQMAEKQAVDDTRRRRLRKMLKTRKMNKGELQSVAISKVERNPLELQLCNQGLDALCVREGRRSLFYGNKFGNVKRFFIPWPCTKRPQ